MSLNFLSQISLQVHSLKNIEQIFMNYNKICDVNQNIK